MTNLILHMKKKWFDLIANGFKAVEYRAIKPYWTKRLEGRKYDGITIILGYPKMLDDTNHLIFQYVGYTTKSLINHEEFGHGTTTVYAIPLVPVGE